MKIGINKAYEISIAREQLLVIDPNLFKNPPKSFRGIPFWSINDLLDEKEIIRQIILLDEAGFGGAFFHAREGLITPFLSDEWFKAFETAVKEAKARGMSIWIYDEDRWPSGFAGGYIPALNHEYRAKALIMIADSKCFNGSDTIAMFRCKISEDNLPIECERIHRNEADSRYLYLTFVRYIAPVGDIWYSGFSYVDTLNRDAITKFIEVAYKPYIDRFKEFIDSVIPGVFTDEPRAYSLRLAPTSRRFMVPPRGGRFNVYAIPWSNSLPEYFKRLNGYDIVDKLPELFFDVGDYIKTRFDFWRSITLLFIDAYTKQIYEWCDRHNLRFTGHLLAEDTLLTQIAVGAAMPHYEYMHIPGIDHLGYQIWDSILTVKQVASVANQLGKERVMCEAYGCLGNYPSFEDRKWIGDFLYALGVNMLVHHLVPYSMRGRRKADYGLNFHWSQPWWKYNRVLEDYFARLSYALSQGVRLSEILVLSPMTSIWCLYSPLNISKAKKIENHFLRLLKTLIENHIDFELGDELIISRHGKIEGRELVVGRARYSVVVLPRMVNITRRVLDLLNRFLEIGGRVVVITPSPMYIDGMEKPEEVKELLRRAIFVDSEEDVVKVLKSVDTKIIVEGDGGGNVLIHPRVSGNGLVLFIANVDKTNSYTVRVGVKGSYSIELYDPFTGNIESYFGIYENGRTWIKMQLKSAESKLFILKPGEPSGEVTEVYTKVKEIDIGGVYTIRRRNLNTLVLDFAQIYFDGEGWSDFKHLYRIREELVRLGYGTEYKLRFKFIAEFKPNTPIYLVVENPTMYRYVKVNNVELDKSKDCGFWIDQSFRKFDISNMVTIGENIVEIGGILGLEPEIEPIYILGDFAVNESPYGESKIIPEQSNIDLTHGVDFCKCGYPFYSGEIELYKTFTVDSIENFDKVELLIEKVDAALAILYINDIEVGKIIQLNKPSIDITKFVKQGENKLKIVLVGTLRNLFGPLHKEDPWWISPETFYVIDEKWDDRYILRSFGLKGIKLVLYKKS